MRAYYHNNEIAYQELQSLENPPCPSLLSFINIIYEKDDFKNKKILDLGCGTGEVTSKFLEVTSDVTGVDVSYSAITLAKDSFPGISFQCKDFVEDDLGENYQLIFDSHSLHNIVFDHERKKAFRNIYCSLRSGGFFAMETMVYHDEMELSDQFILDEQFCLFKNVSSDRYYGIKEFDGQLYIPYRRILPSYLIEEELKNAGFTIVYLIVSNSQKMVIDAEWPFAIRKDPDRMRVICIKE